MSDVFRRELVRRVAKDAGIMKKQAAAAIDSFSGVVVEAMTRGDKVQITGFGTFYVKERAERTGRNPHTGEAVEIPARKKICFEPGSKLKNIKL